MFESINNKKIQSLAFDEGEGMSITVNQVCKFYVT